MSQSPVCLLMLMSEDIQNSNVIVTNKKKKKKSFFPFTYGPEWSNILFNPVGCQLLGRFVSVTGNSIISNFFVQ